MTTSDLLAAIGPVIAALDELGVAYSVVGSVASSAHGIARSTLDADLVVDLRAADVDALVTALERDYYVDRDVARDAVRRRAMFNVIHLATMFKVDLYVLTDRDFDRSAFARRIARPLTEGGPDVQIGTPEDVLLHKLEWYRAGGEVSDRQWSDIRGVVEVQSDALDRHYLDTWSRVLGVSDLLERAWHELGRT